MINAEDTAKRTSSLYIHSTSSGEISQRTLKHGRKANGKNYSQGFKVTSHISVINYKQMSLWGRNLVLSTSSAKGSSFTSPETEEVNRSCPLVWCTNGDTYSGQCAIGRVSKAAAALWSPQGNHLRVTPMTQEEDVSREMGREPWSNTWHLPRLWMPNLHAVKSTQDGSSWLVFSKDCCACAFLG